MGFGFECRLLPIGQIGLSALAHGGDGDGMMVETRGAEGEGWRPTTKHHPLCINGAGLVRSATRLVGETYKDRIR